MRWFNLFYLNTTHIKLALRVDRYQFHFQNSCILAVGATIPIILGLYLNEFIYGVSAFIGALLVGLYNPDEPYPVLTKILVATLIGVCTGGIVGLLVSGSDIWIIFSSIGVAALCGYIGVMGPHAAVIGMFTLVSFCVFAGKPTMTNMELVLHALCLIAGGGLQLFMALVGSNPKGFNFLRKKLTNCYCLLGNAAQQRPLNLLSPVFITTVFQVNNDILLSGASGKTAKWLHDLSDNYELVRFNLIQLSYQIECESDLDKKLLLEGYCCLVGKKLQALGKTISNPKYLKFFEQIIRPSSLKMMDQTLQAYPEYLVIEQVLEQIYIQLNRPFPVGKNCQIATPLRLDIHPFKAMGGKFTANSIFLRHSIKLAIIIPLAWLLGFHLLGSNQFWVPLTIAWISKPDYVGTIPRNLARIFGTILGVILVALVIAVFHPSQWAIVVICFLTIFGIYFNLFVNYAIAVSFITATILFLIEIVQPHNEYAILQERISATLIGGILVLIAANIKPIFNSPKIIPSFINFLNVCKDYVTFVDLDSKNILIYTRAIKVARIETMTLIENAKSEPNQIKILSNETVEKLLLSILEGMFAIIGFRTNAFRAGSHSDIDVYFHDVEISLNLLINKFDGLSKGLVIPDDGVMRQMDAKLNNPAVASFARAYTYLVASEKSVTE